MFIPVDRDRQMVHLGPTFWTISQNYGGGGGAPMPKIKISVELNDMGGKGCKSGKGCSLF